MNSFFSAFIDKSISISTWLLDSGASHHMTDDKRELVEYEDLSTPIYITMTNGQQLKAQVKGTVCCILENGRTVKLTELLHMPGLDKKLVSVAALTARGVLLQFKRDQAVLMSNDVIVAILKRVGKLFRGM